MQRPRTRRRCRWGQHLVVLDADPGVVVALLTERRFQGPNSSDELRASSPSSPLHRVAELRNPAETPTAEAGAGQGLPGTRSTCPASRVSSTSETLTMVTSAGAKLRSWSTWIRLASAARDEREQASQRAGLIGDLDGDPTQPPCRGEPSFDHAGRHVQIDVAAAQDHADAPPCELRRAAQQPAPAPPLRRPRPPPSPLPSAVRWRRRSPPRDALDLRHETGDVAEAVAPDAGHGQPIRSPGRTGTAPARLRPAPGSTWARWRPRPRSAPAPGAGS